MATNPSDTFLKDDQELINYANEMKGTTKWNIKIQE
jgi:hypothetical protein